MKMKMMLRIAMAITFFFLHAHLIFDWESEGAVLCRWLQTQNLNESRPYTDTNKQNKQPNKQTTNKQQTNEQTGHPKKERKF
jgi:hypothetical protein